MSDYSICFHGLGSMTQAIDNRIFSKIKRFYQSSRKTQAEHFQHLSNNTLHIAGVSSNGINWLVSSLKLFEPSECWLLTKGLRIEDNYLFTFPEYLQSQLPLWKFGMIAGPALACDVERKNIPIALMLASTMSTKKITSVFDTSCIDFSYSKDLLGVCYLAALKNIYAIILGYALSISMSTFAMLYARSCSELKQWLVMMNADPLTMDTVSGIGDLIATALGGRNAKFGYYLAQGLTPSQILSGPMDGITVEGYTLAISLLNCSIFHSEWLKIYPSSIIVRLVAVMGRNEVFEYNNL